MRAQVASGDVCREGPDRLGRLRPRRLPRRLPSSLYQQACEASFRREGADSLDHLQTEGGAWKEGGVKG